MNTIYLILFFAAISYLDYRYMIRNKKKQAMVIYTIILGIAFTLSEIHVLGVRVMGLNQLVMFIFDLFRGKIGY